MSEEQLRDVLARVVPEAPDSVTDPAPVVRAARARRRAQVALAGGAVAVIAIGGDRGWARAWSTTISGPQVADERVALGRSLLGRRVSRSAPGERSPAGPLRGEGGPLLRAPASTASRPSPVRRMPWSRGSTGSRTPSTALPAADPARCAAVDVIPSDSRLAFELADGSLAFVP